MLVDHSHGTYPLVLLKEVKHHSKKSRFDAFCEAVDDLHVNKLKIIEWIEEQIKKRIFQSGNYYWCKLIDKEIEKYFAYPAKEYYE